MGREAELHYNARDRPTGVPHHAKAGNINAALLKAAPRGVFTLILDCDMVPHPDLLLRALPHFYTPAAETADRNDDDDDDTGGSDDRSTRSSRSGSYAKGSNSDISSFAKDASSNNEQVWVLKNRAGFVQVPQDFWNGGCHEHT